MQIYLSICLFLISSISFAGTSGSDNKSPTWHFGGGALYLQPTFGGNSLGYSTFSNYSENTFNNVTTVVPNWGWGFQFEGAYFITPTNKIDVNWYHLSRETTGEPPRMSLYGGSAGGLYAGIVSINPKWNAVNVEAAQYFPLNQHSVFSVHAGIAYVQIINSIDNEPKLLPNAPDPLFKTTDTITYNGLGPHVGGDLNYRIGYGLSVYTRVAGSMLVGGVGQTIWGYKNYLDNARPYSSGNYNQHHSGIVVPEVEAKLGMNYIYATEEGNLTFDLGYLWINYLNVLISQVGVGVVGSSVSTSTAANFDLNGLYFGLKWTAYV